MIFSRGVAEAARNDLARLRATLVGPARALLDDCVDVLYALLRYDPHRLGTGAAETRALRAFSCGVVRVYYIVRPLEDRFVQIAGFGTNPDWVD